MHIQIGLGQDTAVSLAPYFSSLEPGTYAVPTEVPGYAPTPQPAVVPPTTSPSGQTFGQWMQNNEGMIFLLAICAAVFLIYGKAK